MAVKAVEMIRKIRDRHYEQTKGLSVNEQIEFVKKQAEKLHKKLKRSQRLTADKRTQKAKV